MTAPKREPTRLSGALAGAVASLPIEGRDRLLLLAAWSDAVGHDMARSAQPGTMSGGTLTVEVEHEGWESTLRSYERAIVERLVARTGLPIARLEPRVKRTLRGGCR